MLGNGMCSTTKITRGLKIQCMRRETGFKDHINIIQYVIPVITISIIEHNTHIQEVRILKKSRWEGNEVWDFRMTCNLLQYLKEAKKPLQKRYRKKSSNPCLLCKAGY